MKSKKTQKLVKAAPVKSLPVEKERDVDVEKPNDLEKNGTPPATKANDGKDTSGLLLFLFLTTILLFSASPLCRK
jgi:hypothetical protein